MRSDGLLNLVFSSRCWKMQHVFTAEGPVHPSSPSSVCLCSDISRNNILATATNAVLPDVHRFGSNSHIAHSGKVPKQTLFFDVERHGPKRPFDESADPNQNGMLNGSAVTRPEDEVNGWGHNGEQEEEVKLSRIYLCDLERPAWLYKIFEFSGRPVVLKWTACGTQILLCTDLGLFYILFSKNGALNSWHPIHKGSLSIPGSIVHASWLRASVKFVATQNQPLEEMFDLPEKTKITAVLPENSGNSYTDPGGFFVISDEGTVTLVVTRRPSHLGSSSAFFTHSVKSQLHGDHVDMVDSVYDSEENLFYVMVGDSASSDVACFRMAFPTGSSLLSRHIAVVCENLPSLPLRNSASKICFLSTGYLRERHVCLATKSPEGDNFVEIWTLNVLIQDDFLAQLDGETSPEKLSWTFVAEQPVADEIVMWQQPVKLVSSSEVDRAATVAVGLKTGNVLVYDIRISGDVAVQEVSNVEVLSPLAATTLRGKKLAKTPEFASTLFSSNGRLLIVVDKFCRVFGYIRDSLADMDVPDESSLTIGYDNSDLCFGPHSPDKLVKLDAVFQGMAIVQKRSSATAYYRIKSLLVEKIHGQESGFIITQTLFFELFLSYLEQFMWPESPNLSSIFQISELEAVLHRTDVNLDKVVSVVQAHVALDKLVTYQLQTGFHHIFAVIIDFFSVCVKHPQVLPHTGEAVEKIRLILALLASWAASNDLLMHLWRRPPFYSSGIVNILDVLFDVSTQLFLVPMEENWAENVTQTLREVGIDMNNGVKSWSEQYFQSTPRASIMNGDSPARVVFLSRFPFSPGQTQGFRTESKDDKVDAEENGILQNKPGKRKICDRCFFVFPWSLASDYSGSWLTHMRHRWSTCFCGGQWILAQ